MIKFPGDGGGIFIVVTCMSLGQLDRLPFRMLYRLLVFSVNTLRPEQNGCHFAEDISSAFSKK